jgi:hypothetical protein
MGESLLPCQRKYCLVNFIAADISSNACKTLAQSEPHGKSISQIRGVVLNAPDQRYRVVSPS